VGVADVENTVTTERGSHVTTMSNGERIYVQYRGKGMLTDKGAPIGSEGTWTFKGGTGDFAEPAGHGHVPRRGQPGRQHGRSPSRATGRSFIDDRMRAAGPPAIVAPLRELK
jgi:hypothetical protein